MVPLFVIVTVEAERTVEGDTHKVALAPLTVTLEVITEDRISTTTAWLAVTLTLRVERSELPVKNKLYDADKLVLLGSLIATVLKKSLSLAPAPGPLKMIALVKDDSLNWQTLAEVEALYVKAPAQVVRNKAKRPYKEPVAKKSNVVPLAAEITRSIAPLTGGTPADPEFHPEFKVTAPVIDSVVS
jgi:hypothetical protein